MKIVHRHDIKDPLRMIAEEVKKGYISGIKVFEILFEDFTIPDAIAMNSLIELGDEQIPAAELMFKMFEDFGIPKGKFEAKENNMITAGLPYCMKLIYTIE